MSQIPLTIRDAAAALRSGEFTSVELTTACLARADALDSTLGTYVTRFDSAALAAASNADRELAAGVDHGPMHGIPVGVKDILAMSEGPTTAQSLVLDSAWGAGKEGPVVRRLKAAGAVITGKTTTAEFALGLPDYGKPFPIPRNPWNTANWPGGSSSGTANGVAAGFFFAGIGSDTGGSIRIPAAFCSTSGLVPTFGLVPKSGCVPLAFTLDRIGPLARSAWDCAAMLQTLAGHDSSDPSSIDRPVPNYLATIDEGIACIRIGVMRDHHFVDSDAGAESTFDAALAQLEALGATLVDISIPYYAEVSGSATITMAAEAMAYHRNDAQVRWCDYFERTRERLVRGVLVAGADYVQAQRVRRIGQRALAKVFSHVDVIATPTASVGAPTYDAINSSGVRSVIGSLHTLYWSAVGTPALVVPMGFTDGEMPLSLHLSALHFNEEVLLRVGHAYQSVTDWHVRVPQIDAIQVALPEFRPPSSPVPKSTPTADDRIVSALLAAAGIAPSAEELMALINDYSTMKRTIEAVHAVEAARYEDMCLTFRAEAEFLDWATGQA